MLAKCLAGILGTGLLLIATFPVLFSGDDSDQATDPCATPAAGTLEADVPAILATIRQQESGGDYRARAAGSSSSGAYQFTDATWSGHGGYAHASDAPPAIQDAAATEHVTGILGAHDNDLSAVPVVWYLGYLPPPDDPAWDTIPSPGAGNRLTPRQYQQAWLTSYAQTRSSTPTTAGTGACPPADGDLVTVEGITVAAQIAPQVEQLIHDARTAGYDLTGSGYRSHERQIELRRAHCGTSHYAIYEMPSSQCSPPTARPGSSLHEQGLAIDFTCNGTLIESRHTACFTWLAEHAPTHGLHNLPTEPWHWSSTGD